VEIGDAGIEILPLEVRRRVLAMREAAQQIAGREDMRSTIPRICC
jgi:hypothetical protein